jgi:hypothetical protein
VEVWRCGGRGKHVYMGRMGHVAGHGAGSHLTQQAAHDRNDASQNDYTTRYRNGRHVNTIPRRNE